MIRRFKRLTAVLTAGTMLFCPALQSFAAYQSREEIAFSLRPIAAETSGYTINADTNTVYVPLEQAGGSRIRFGMYIEAEYADMAYLMTTISSSSELVRFTSEGYHNPTAIYSSEKLSYTLSDGTEFSTQLRPYCFGRINSSGVYVTDSLGVLTSFNTETNQVTTNWQYGLSIPNSTTAGFLGSSSDEFSYIEFEVELDDAITTGTYTLSFAEDITATYVTSDDSDEGGSYSDILPTLKNAEIIVYETDYRGDVNFDNSADATDASLILVYAAAQGAGIPAPLYSGEDADAEATALQRADVDKSGEIDATDASYILSYAAHIGSGKPVTWEELITAPPVPTEPDTTQPAATETTPIRTESKPPETSTMQTETTQPDETTASEPTGILSLNSLPNKRVYRTGEALDLTGLAVSLDYCFDASGRRTILNNVSPLSYPEDFIVDTSDFDSSTPGTYIIHVTCTEETSRIYWVNDYDSISFKVCVTEAPSTSEEPTEAVTTAPETTIPETTTTEPATETTTTGTETTTTEPTSETTTTETHPGQPSSYQLEVKCIMQNDDPALPTGCEATALAIVLNHAGFSVGKYELATQYLPKMYFTDEYGADFRYVFPGNPADYSGYGCYAPAITAMANAYFTAQKNASYAENISGLEFDKLLDYVAQGTPVIFNATMGLVEPEAGRTWTTPDGNTVQWIKHEHCLVLTGYDKTAGVVFVADPLRGNVTYDMALARERYNQMGKNAVVLHTSDATSIGTNSIENNAVYTLQNAESGKFLTVYGGEDADVINVVQASEKNDASQKFRIVYQEESNTYRLAALCSSDGRNRVIDIVKTGGCVTGGCNVEIYRPVDADAQDFVLLPEKDGTFVIASRTNRSACLAVTDTETGTANGTAYGDTGNVVMEHGSGLASQKWILKKVSD